MSQLATNQSGSKYGDQDRMQAVIEYSVHGSLAKVEEYTGISKRTLLDWTKTEWWQDQLGRLHDQNKDIFKAQYSQAVLEGLEQVRDRIKNGDAYVTKDGEIARKPASLRDLSTATGIALDKLRLLNNEPTSITKADNGELLKLKQAFEQLSSTKVIEGEVSQPNQVLSGPDE